MESNLKMNETLERLQNYNIYLQIQCPLDS